MAQDPGSTPRKKHGFSNVKLRMSAPNPSVKGGRWAQLGFGVWNNNPRIILFTNDPNLSGQENNFGQLQVPVDHIVLATIVEEVKKYINSKEPGKTKIANMTAPPRGSESKEFVNSSDIWIGKDDEGVIFISVVAKDSSKWPTIKFPFNNSDGRFHIFYHGDGKPYTKAELSTVYAKAWVNLLSSAIGSDVVVNYATPITPFNNGKGNYQNKGGGNWNKGNSNNYQKQSSQESYSDTGPADIEDDDVPW